MPERLLHAVFVRALVDLGPIVIDAVTDHRPAVIAAFLDDVDLIAAARTVLVLPQLAARRIECQALRIADSVSPDFRLGIAPAHEGVVGRSRTIRANADDLSDVVGGIPRLV